MDASEGAGSAQADEATNRGLIRGAQSHEVDSRLKLSAVEVAKIPLDGRSPGST
jgi:hypothetical protein